ncbi:MAG: hypothetical protein GY850_38150 [bacterium]|nr:hypothetical protein [bacterium]
MIDTRKTMGNNPLTTDNRQQTTDKTIEGCNLVSKPTHPIVRLIQSLIIIVIVSFNFFAPSAADPKRIALLPFKINSAQDLSFLKDGIFDMLTSRLSKEGRVEVYSREQVEGAVQTEAASGNINEATARGIGTRLNADFVLFGSLTVLGENVSIDAKMVDISGGKPTMTFFDQSRDLGAVITKINLIAADINARMFDRTMAATKTPAAAAPPQPTKKKDIYVHPESVLKQDGFIRQGETDAANSGIIMPGEARESQAKFWKSANFKHLIHGISLGDVDGDEKIETVIITPHEVIIYRSEAGRFQKLQEIPAGRKSLTAVDVADVNGNGYAEIFVTSLNAHKNALVSMVFEYDGENFVKIVDDSPWFYRVADTPARGRILLGQRSRVAKHHSGKIYELIAQNGEYVPTDRIKTPRETNLLGFTIGDVLNNGQENAVAYRRNDHLRVIDSAGKVIWDGGDRLGGSMLYYNGPKEDLGDIENRKYLPMRLLVRKNRASDGMEVITVKNHELTGRRLEYRKFTKSHIEAFTWNGMGLAPNWKTRQISGYIQDFALGDFDNDGRDELIAAVVLKEGRIILASEPKSTMIAYELESPPGNDD